MIYNQNIDSQLQGTDFFLLNLISNSAPSPVAEGFFMANRKLKDKICLHCNKEFRPVNSKIKYCSRFCYKQQTKGNKNPNWKGWKSVYIKHPRKKLSNKYEALHSWLKNKIKKPKLCENCNENKPYDLANISQRYKRNLSDWEWLCRSCHMIKDGRLNKLVSIPFQSKKLFRDKKGKFIKNYDR